MRSIKVLAVALTALAGAAATAALAYGGGPMYFHIFYEDASMTVQVGARRDVCMNGVITAGPVTGRVSNYSEQIPTGQYCQGYASSN